MNEAPGKLDDYRAVKDQPKPGFLVRHDKLEELFFWSDLIRVVYDAQGASETDEDERPEEMIQLFFSHYLVTVRGHKLRDLLTDCQRHRVDWIRVSPKETIMYGKGTIITKISIEEKKGR